MTDRLPLEERVDRYLLRHPEASAVQIAGALEASIDDVEGALEDDPEPDPAAIAEAVAGPEDERPQPEPDPSVDAAIEAALQRRDEDVQDEDVDDTSAAAFMGGDSPHASDEPLDVDLHDSPSSSLDDVGAAMRWLTGDVEQTPVLPGTQALDPATSGWDWRHAGAREASEADLVDEARERTTEKIVDAIGSGDRLLLEALPTLGKSYGAVKAAAETGEPVTIVTTRGNKEQYGQLEEWCEEFGLEHKRLPAFTRDCETARGDHGDDWKETVRSWYRRGATGQEIHALAEKYHGEQLPCQREGECDLAHAWDFDPDDYDVLIGHYAHAYKANVVRGRTVLVDEFPEEAYEQRLDHGIEGAISYFLQEHEGIPFEDYADLIEGRHDEQRRADALAFLEEYGLDSDAQAVIANRVGHAAAPAAAFTILAGAKADLGNGWERAEFPDDGRTGLFDRQEGAVQILDPPDLFYSSAVVGLDGTPTKKLWKLALGQPRLNHVQVLTDGEREEYIQEGLNLNLVRTTEAIKPYNNEDHVNVDRDGALLEAIADQHDERPGVISSRRALDVYEREELLAFDPGSGDVQEGPADRVAYYGNVLGSNEFREKRVGAVIGSNHYGDRYIEKWGAYADHAVERQGKGAELSYGPFGDRILQHMREHDTLQAAMRFGRDGNGAVVYVHTDTLPDWVPVAGEGRVVSTWSDGMRQVLEAVDELGSWRTADVVDHPAVEIGRRRVFDVLEDLAERGYLTREAEGRGYVWRDDGLHRIGEHGRVELDPVEVHQLEDDEVAELSRSSTYTWNFPNLAGRDRCGGAAASSSPQEADDTVANGGGRGSPGGGGPT